MSEKEKKRWVIPVSKETRDALIALKEYHRQTYDDVIVELLKAFKTASGQFNLKPSQGANVDG